LSFFVTDLLLCTSDYFPFIGPSVFFDSSFDFFDFNRETFLIQIEILKFIKKGQIRILPGLQDRGVGHKRTKILEQINDVEILKMTVSRCWGHLILNYNTTL
jgi:hypothetical protein